MTVDLATGQISHRLTALTLAELRAGQLFALDKNAEGLWVTEEALRQALHTVVAKVPGVHLQGCRFTPASQKSTKSLALNVTLSVAILHQTAYEYGVTALATTVRQRVCQLLRQQLGFAVAKVDIHVLDLLPTETETPAQPLPAAAMAITAKNSEQRSNGAALYHAIIHTVISTPGVIALYHHPRSVLQQLTTSRSAKAIYLTEDERQVLAEIRVATSITARPVKVAKAIHQRVIDLLHTKMPSKSASVEITIVELG